jgi:glycosyltransferase involved in cell wall biosynthesis
MPKVTVITPVYNAEKYLRLALDSVLSQTFTDFEYLVINDGSKDSSPEIIRSYNDPRIRFIDNGENQGLAKIRNLGLSEVKTEYLAWFDADDSCHPERLAKQVEFLDANPDYALCCTDTDLMDEAGKVFQHAYYQTPTAPLEWLMLWANQVANSSTMARKSTLTKNDLSYRMDAPPAEDYDLWCRLAFVSKIARLNEALVIYRVSSTGAFRSEQTKGMQNALRCNLQLAEKLTDAQPPALHRELGDFRSWDEITVAANDFVDLTNWIHRLLRGARAHWHWGVRDSLRARRDAYRRLRTFFKRLPENTQMEIGKQLRGRGKLIMYLVLTRA